MYNGSNYQGMKKSTVHSAKGNKHKELLVIIPLFSTLTRQQNHDENVSHVSSFLLSSCASHDHIRFIWFSFFICWGKNNGLRKTKPTSTSPVQCSRGIKQMLKETQPQENSASVTDRLTFSEKMF